MQSQVDKVRHFNRFYTRLIGVLEEHLLQSRFSLVEARVIYELAHRPGATATEVGEALGLDPGYLSRLLKKFQSEKLVVRKRCPRDARQFRLELTPAGRAEFASLDAGSNEAVGQLLDPLTPSQTGQLLGCMDSIERLLGDPPPRLCLLRDPLPGELGWVVAQHGELYAREYGWGEKFEGLVARVVGDYLVDHDPDSDACWIAEVAGRPAGSVMVVREDETTARLRLLLLDPRARGMGLGGRLLQQCLDFARARGYRRMVLWTQEVLVAARSLYESAGFRLASREKHTLFGPELMSETWELDL